MKFFNKQINEVDKTEETKILELDNKAGDEIKSNKNEISLSEDEFLKLFDEVIDEFIIKKPNFINQVERGLTNREALKQEIFSFINKKARDTTEKDKEYLLKRFETYIWGYGELQELIDDENITDIKTINENNIRIKVKGKRKKSNVVFRNKEKLKQYIEYIAIKNNSSLSEINAIQNFTDKSTNDKFILRINISSTLINSDGLPHLVIRKIPKFKDDLLKLQSKGMFNTEIIEYLKDGIKSGLSIFVGGKGAEGKTTLINALIDEIPFDKSGLVIQESEELFSSVHPDLLFQKVKYSKGESRIQYTLKDLSINGLLIDLDYFIIGEIKGEEAMDMVNAIFTGHTGISSVHCSSSIEGVDKLMHYMKYSKGSADMRVPELLKMLSHIDVFIFMKDFKTFEITEIEGFDIETERLVFNKVFEYQIKEVDGVLKGSFVRLNESCDKVKNKLLYTKFVRQQSNVI